MPANKYEWDEEVPSIKQLARSTNGTSQPLRFNDRDRHRPFCHCGTEKGWRAMDAEPPPDRHEKPSPVFRFRPQS
jgi:hypothetical protein